MCVKIIFIYGLHRNLSAKTYADEPTFTLQRLLLPGEVTHKTVMRPASLVSVCVCLHNSDLQHLLVDAIMAVGAEVGLVLVLSELGHSTQVTGFTGFCIQYQTLSQQPERTPDSSTFSFSY